MAYHGGFKDGKPEGKGIIFLRVQKVTVIFKSTWEQGKIGNKVKAYIFNLKFYNQKPEFFKNIDLKKPLRKQIPGRILYRGKYVNRIKEGDHIVYHKKDGQNEDIKRYLKKYKGGEEVHLYSDYEDPYTEEELDEQTTLHYHENGQIKYERKGDMRYCYFENGSINYKYKNPKKIGDTYFKEAYYRSG